MMTEIVLACVAFWLNGLMMGWAMILVHRDGKKHKKNKYDWGRNYGV